MENRYNGDKFPSSAREEAKTVWVGSRGKLQKLEFKDILSKIKRQGHDILEVWMPWTGELVYPRGIPEEVAAKMVAA